VGTPANPVMPLPLIYSSSAAAVEKFVKTAHAPTVKAGDTWLNP
jgi:hypothetical protein